MQYPPYEGVPIIGTRDDVVHFLTGFVLPFALSLAYPVMKDIPMNQMQLLVSEKVLRFADVNGGNRKTLAPRLSNDAVDAHKICGIGLFQAPIDIVEFLLAISGVAWAVP